MSPIPLALTIPGASLMPMSSNDLVSDTQSYFEKRWYFSGGGSQEAEASWTRGWNSTKLKGWAGTWEVGKLMMSTGIIFGGMLGAFLLVALIFWACGMLDDRRLKRRARKFAKMRSQMLEQESNRPANSKTETTTFEVGEKPRNNQRDMGEEIIAHPSVSKRDGNRVYELIGLEEPFPGCSTPGMRNTNYLEDKKEASGHVPGTPLRPTSKSQSTQGPYNWYGSYRGSHDTIGLAQ